ncbi:hypothetical protein SAMN06265365_115130 [Tistlia consotensis]|uniref:DUF4345 domain-containing protein n=1 Tax=Tistlia consotensis USBA 355 TaxID=560819 RepID=A0A1Y6C4J0_9PROT|nr:DUF6790 family protein [Tistlia consotensis]SMF45405.1 hypothetical protein SAMN05428998_1163 [Tistlia consotensis USBA 355]SNR79940.1 hypothetical protein SAMN06265365_115130 [Tistlia consotensis]
MNPIMAFVPAILYAIALVLALLGVGVPAADPGLAPLAQWMLLVSLGLMSLWAFLGHVFVAEQVARSIGWETSPFQYEVGVANLGIGTAAIAATWLGAPAAWAVFLVSACFLWGAAIGHLREMVQERNFAINNCGPIFWWDILTPLTLLVGLLAA